MALCSKCHGDCHLTCPDCGGKGCENCDYNGEIRCDECHGSGTVSEDGTE